MTEVQLINKYLKKKHGSDDQGRPYFRVMMSDRNYTEKRRGTFHTFYHSIYLRTEENVVKDVPKYSAFTLQERYVLEGLVFQPNPELPESLSGHYEMLWPFVNFHDNSYLPPNRKVCDIIIYMAKQKKRSSEEIRNHWEEVDKKDQAEEEALFRDQIEEVAPYVAMQIKEGHGVGYGPKDHTEPKGL